jgi:hypothetical protein
VVLVDDTDVIVQIRRETVRDPQHVRGNEGRGPDLDKKDIEVRSGVSLEIVLA